MYPRRRTGFWGKPGKGIELDGSQRMWLNIQRIEQRKWYLSQHSTHAAIGSKLFVLGGWSRLTESRSNRATYFDMTTETFGEVARMPRGPCCGVCGVIDGRLYLAGGFWQWVDDVSDCRETWSFVPAQ